MLEMLNGNGAGMDAVEWRVARPEDGPVWVALTREGRTPPVPPEALAEPDQRMERDRHEQQDELTRFQTDPTGHHWQRFLLWRASRPLGRLCFRVQETKAHLGGIALLPTLEPKLNEQVARQSIARAQHADARSITAVYEARHTKAFTAAGFREVRRFTPMVAATRRVLEENEEEMEPAMLSTLYRIRPIAYIDSGGLGALLHEAYLDERDKGGRSPLVWLAEMAQLLEGSDNTALPECSYVAELRQSQRQTSKVLGAVLVSRWQGAALIDELAVLPRYRRRGIGAALVRHAMLGLRQHNYASVMLMVTEGSAAQQFYRRFGFREAQPSYVEAERTLV